MYTRPDVGRVYINTMAALINVHAANWPHVLKYTRPIVHLAFPKSTACMYAATYTRLTFSHVYSDRTRGELQVAKSSVFCSDIGQLMALAYNLRPALCAVFLCFVIYLKGVKEIMSNKFPSPLAQLTN